MFSSKSVQAGICLVSLINVAISLDFLSSHSFFKTHKSKSFSGRKVRNDSVQMIYYYDQTIAIVELGPNQTLITCELIEVYEPDDQTALLHDLKSISRPISVNFTEIMRVINNCDQSEPSKSFGSFYNPFIVFNGIIPGTKWCGIGDVAKDYHDLGTDRNLDKCCRTHDLCPIKIRVNHPRYNLTVNFWSYYTKSHCKCDEDFYYCLKNNKSLSSYILGQFYFNIIQTPCLENVGNGFKIRKVQKSFF